MVKQFLVNSLKGSYESEEEIMRILATAITEISEI